MGFNARDIVAVIELIFFIPTAILAAIVCARLGFKRSSGWIYTLILCVVRIAGAVCQFLSRTDHSTGLIKTSIVIDTIGLSPLLLATLAILHRLVDFINTKTAPTFTTKHFRVLQIFISVGLILSIAGGTSSTAEPDGTVKVATTSKVGIALLIVAYVGLILIYVASLGRVYAVPHKERRSSLAIMIALPFILVRLIYSVCAVFLHNSLFNRVTGSVAVLVAMSVVEEFVVVAIYILLGLVLGPLEESAQGNTVQKQDRVAGHRQRVQVHRVRVPR